MILLNLFSIITAGFVFFGLILCGFIIWTILSRRDKQYKAKYIDFLQQKQRVTNKLRNDK